MARYTGPKTRIARKFGEPIFGADKVLSKKNYPPGQHDNKEGTLATAPIIQNDSVLKNEYIKKKPIYKKQEGLPSLADLL